MSKSIFFFVEVHHQRTSEPYSTLPHNKYLPFLIHPVYTVHFSLTLTKSFLSYSLHPTTLTSPPPPPPCLSSSSLPLLLSPPPLPSGDVHEAPKGFQWKGRGQKTFLYDIVANKRNGVDVDRFDYFRRYRALTLKRYALHSSPLLSHLCALSFVLREMSCHDMSYHVMSFHQHLSVCLPSPLLCLTIFLSDHLPTKITTCFSSLIYFFFIF
jgi:hypothetical protein